jgi:hypothetical protein
MAFSLLGYFVSMIMVLTAAVGVTIGLSSFSASEGVRHYPRPVLEQLRPVHERNITAPNGEPRLFMSVPDTKEASPAKNAEDNFVAAIDEKADPKSKPHKHKTLARHRNNYERPGYWNVPGYAETLQRPFSTW